MHALVVMAHPASSSLTRSIANAVADGVVSKGHTAELADLAAEGFDPVFGALDHAAFAGLGPIPHDVRREQQRIDRADHLVLVHPVYWWSMPALLKGWIDRVFVSGWAFEEGADGTIIKKLARLNIHLIALAGADSSTYVRHGYRESMRTQIEHGIFGFCGAPVVTSELIPSQGDDVASSPSLVAKLIARHLA